MKKFLGYGRADFLTGLAVVLPVAVSVTVAVWLFGTVSHFTDVLPVLVPKSWIGSGGTLPSSICALMVVILLIGLVGRIGGYRTPAAPL